MDLLDRMLGYDGWTTGQALGACRGLTGAQLDQPFVIGHGTLRQTLAHVVGAVAYWTGQMAGEAPAPPPAEASTDALVAWHGRVHAAFAAAARRARDEGRLDEAFLDRYHSPQSRGGTILQVVAHGAQHRAEVRHMLTRPGVEDLPDGDPLEWEHKAHPELFPAD